MSQANVLHRALLRPALIHLLRAAGFHSTRPSVLDTLTDIAERYLLLLASTTARHAELAHNEPVPTITDVRMALTECGALIPAESATEEVWREIMRVPVEELGRQVEGGRGAGERVRAEKRKREDEDLRDVVEFTQWFDGKEHLEARRIAGMVPDATVPGALPAVGVGGGVVQAEDFLAVLRKKIAKGGDDSRLQGTVLGRLGEDREVLVEGGPVQRIGDWRPRVDELTAEETQKEDGVVAVEGRKEASNSGTEPGDAAPAAEVTS